MQCNRMQSKCNLLQGIYSNAMQTIEVLPRLTFEDLRKELEQIRGTMPKRTLYHWLNRLDIIPTTEGYYTPDDLEILKQLNRFLRRVPNINKFRQALMKEIHQCL